MATKECDLLIVGGGPAGFSAAINGASEGLHVILIDSGPEPGGQARKSSLIENYPGFVEGITGEKLLARMVDQARKFRADIRCPDKAIGLREDGDKRVITTEDDDVICAKSGIILAVGLSYNRLDAENIGAFMGRGVQYGAPTIDPRLLGDCEICIVGGANSAGQAAMHLSKNMKARVKLLVRRPIEDQMSAYLVERLKTCKNVEVVMGVEVVKVDGKEHLEEVTLKDVKDGTTRQIPARHLFIFIGASPKTQWLNGSVAADEKRFILTDSRLMEGPEKLWTQNRPPLSLETSMPGVFACGDVRLNTTKRIASAVGEGSMALQSCHAYRRLMGR